jgi:hypothetical protein
MHGKGQRDQVSIKKSRNRQHKPMADSAINGESGEVREATVTGMKFPSYTHHSFMAYMLSSERLPNCIVPLIAIFNKNISECQDNNHGTVSAWAFRIRAGAW